MEDAHSASINAANKTNTEKWSKVLMEAGWIAFPNIIIERQKALGLSPMDINIILHLASYWWNKDQKPFPAKRTIADSIGVHPRTIQRCIAAMEAAGFIKRIQRRIPGEGSRTNLYDLDGLIEHAKPFAIEKLAERKQQEEANKARASRKGKARLSSKPKPESSNDNV